MDHPQREQLLEAIAYGRTVRLKLVGFHILVGKREFRPKQDDHPAELEPHQEKGQCGKAAVNCIISGHADLKREVRQLENLVQGAGHDAGYMSMVVPTGMIFVPSIGRD